VAGRRTRTVTAGREESVIKAADRGPGGRRCIPAGLQRLLEAHFPRTELQAIRLKVGRPFFLPRAFDGITIGRHIWAPNDFSSRTLEEQLAFLAHELTHVEQYRQLGFLGFLRGYLGEYRANRRLGMNRTEAYRRITFEDQARARSERVLRSADDRIHLG
jgi:hypothetical protein